ncbi:cystathionine beta-lyase [Clostridia bacterium]|nr:cystathionine beta-lyase [Clostridia bacterium]
MSVFDEIIDRTGTGSIKLDYIKTRNKPDGVLPLWVADMDFRTPPCVISALEERVRHGIFGYTDTGESCTDAVCGWFKRRYDRVIEPEWIVKTCGVVTALYLAVNAFTKPGDGVLIQPPVYYPFFESIRDTGRVLLKNTLVHNNGRYEIDFADFSEKLKSAKLFILCSPHNPVGRVWSREELEHLGDLCVKHNVTVISDEIHSDFVYPGTGLKHTVFSGIKPDFERITVTCTSPSKTFNLAGLQLANLIIPDEKLRSVFVKTCETSGFSQLSALGETACVAAYNGGEEWLTELLAYLEDNLSFMREWLNEHIPEIAIVQPEGTYLVWLDFRKFRDRRGLTDRSLDKLILNKAKLWLEDGHIFDPGGESGSGFQRINIASPRAVIAEAMERLLTIAE